MTARRLFLLAFAATLVAGFGCSDDNSTPPTPVFVCADGGNAPANGVNTNCGGALNTSTEQVDIVMGGPASGETTLMGLNFDVTHDPTKLEFVPAASYTSTLFPDALIAVSSVTAGRVIVAIQQPGDLAPVAVTPGQHVVLSLSLRRVGASTFPPTLVDLENSEATSSSAAISFASGTTIAYQ